MNNSIEVYVHLLDEGTPTIRPTQTIAAENGLYRLLPTEKYDPVDETWEFLPGSLVKIIPAKTDEDDDILLAVATN